MLQTVPGSLPKSCKKPVPLAMRKHAENAWLRQTVRDSLPKSCRKTVRLTLCRYGPATGLRHGLRRGLPAVREAAVWLTLCLQQAVREQRDQQVEKLRAKYGPKVQTLQDRLLRAQQ